MGKWDWQVFLQDTGGGRTYLEWLMSAWGWTLSVSVLSLIVALAVGSLMGILRTTPNKWLVLLGECWTELFRNVPLLVQLFIWYFVLPELLPASIGDAYKQTNPVMQQFLASVICLGLFGACMFARARLAVRAAPATPLPGPSGAT